MDPPTILQTIAQQTNTSAASHPILKKCKNNLKNISDLTLNQTAKNEISNERAKL